jgi:hypothetical protein
MIQSEQNTCGGIIPFLDMVSPKYASDDTSFCGHEYRFIHSCQGCYDISIRQRAYEVEAN